MSPNSLGVGDEAIFVKTTPHGARLRAEYMRSMGGWGNLSWIARGEAPLHYGSRCAVTALLSPDCLRGELLYEIQFDARNKEIFAVTYDELCSPGADPSQNVLRVDADDLSPVDF